LSSPADGEGEIGITVTIEIGGGYRVSANTEIVKLRRLKRAAAGVIRDGQPVVHRREVNLAVTIEIRGYRVLRTQADREARNREEPVMGRREVDRVLDAVGIAVLRTNVRPRARHAQADE
jgi:hypothetical protein